MMMKTTMCVLVAFSLINLFGGNLEEAVKEANNVIDRIYKDEKERESVK